MSFRSMTAERNPGPNTSGRSLAILNLRRACGGHFHSRLQQLGLGGAQSIAEWTCA